MDHLRVLFLTLEFSAATFSGNGIYAQSQVRALSKIGHPIFVISGMPATHTEASIDQGATVLMQVPVSKWGRLDASAPHAEFAQLGSQDHIVKAVETFRPDVAMVVDWSALQLYRELAAKLQLPPAASSTAGAAPSPPPSRCVGTGQLPMVYLNYRVFSRTASGAELALVSRLEREAMEVAVLTVALSRSDSLYLMEQVAGSTADAGSSTACCSGSSTMQYCGSDGGAAGGADAGPWQREGEGEGAGRRQRKDVRVLLPALREDMRRLAAALPGTDRGRCVDGDGDADGDECGADDDGGSAAGGSTPAPCPASETFARSRPYLTCCVRLSPEKEPERFVDVVEALQRRGALAALGLTPLMVGAARDAYGEALKARLRAAVPGSVILEHFMGPADLAQVYRSTRLNIHPATYDAFGMTIVEAASQGAPSIVHSAACLEDEGGASAGGAGDGAAGAGAGAGGAGTAGGAGAGGGAVGATDLLSAADGEVLLVDMGAGLHQLVEVVERTLADPQRLLEVALNASRKACSWSEETNAATLMEMGREALQSNGLV